MGDITLPVVDFRRRNKFVDNVKLDIKESVYTIVHNYEKIDIAVSDNGNVVSQEQVKGYADNGTPINMLFKDTELFIRPKTQWELQARGTAQQATIVNSDKGK
jgi:hypothetical protein